MSIKIFFEIGHQAILLKTPTSQGFTHNWELFVRGIDGNDISLYVEKVVFTLHDSFPKPKRVIKDPPYVVKEAGYAAFEMPVTIYFKGKPEDPKKLEFKYDLDLQPFKVQKEEYVFHNPSEDFRRRLLKGGGVAMGKDSLMTSSKTNNSSDSVKKHKHKDEPKVTNTFKTLFGTPITKSSTKVSPDPKSQQMQQQQQQQQQNKISPNSVKSSKAEKPEKVSSSSSSSKDKSEKSEKHKSKHHSPSRERASDSKDSRRDKDDSTRHEKKKDKSHSKEKSSSKSKTKDKARSPSPKRPSSPPPVVKPKPVEPPVATPSDKSSTSSSKKSNKKDKKSSDRDKTKSKEGADKKSDHAKGAKEKDVMATTNNSTKDVLKEKPKHENKIEHSNPATPINDKRSEKGDSERKHKHKKKEKSKDHDRDKDVPKEKKASAKNSNKQQKEESNHTTPSPAKQQKRPESRKQQQQQQQHQHNENTHSQSAAPKMSSRPPVNHETSDSDADSHALSSKVDSDNSLDRRSIKREDSSPSPPPPPPAPAPDVRPSKREKPVKDEKKRKRRSKNESDHSPSPSLMEPPQQKLRKEDIKNGETTPIGSFANANAATPNSNYDNVSSKSFISPSATATNTTTTTSDRTNDYMTELKDLQHKIMTLQDNNDLQQVVEMIAATGQYEITSKTFDFDLCTLEPGLIKRLQEFFGATSCS